MPYFHKPEWCIVRFRDNSSKDYEWCGFNINFTDFGNDTNGKKIPYNGSNDQVGIPSGAIKKISPELEASLCIGCYFFLLLFTLMRLCLKRVTNTARIRTAVMTILLTGLITSKICILIIPPYWGNAYE